jgi:hypothetical protein
MLNHAVKSRDAFHLAAQAGRVPDMGTTWKSTLPFLESVPEVSAKLKAPGTAERKFEDVVKDAEQAAVLVLVY